MGLDWTMFDNTSYPMFVICAVELQVFDLLELCLNWSGCPELKRERDSELVTFLGHNQLIWEIF